MAKGQRKGPTLSELMKQVEIELRHLRGMVRDIFRNCGATVEARIEQATNDLLRARPAAPGAAGMSRQESLMKDALKLMADLRVKPEKGRRRDIKRIYGIAGELAELAARMQ